MAMIIDDRFFPTHEEVRKSWRNRNDPLYIHLVSDNVLQAASEQEAVEIYERELTPLIEQLLTDAANATG